jgi:hypothetical protein
MDLVITGSSAFAMGVLVVLILGGLLAKVIELHAAIIRQQKEVNNRLKALVNEQKLLILSGNDLEGIHDRIRTAEENITAKLIDAPPSVPNYDRSRSRNIARLSSDPCPEVNLHFHPEE